MQKWVLIAVLAWGLTEIGLFVTLGAAMGVWWSLAIVMLTGIAGMLVLRNAFRVMRFDQLRNPRQLIQNTARGGMTVVAGLLLVLPGFLADAIGIMLLAPPLQALFAHFLARRFGTTEEQTRPRTSDDVIEGEFEPVAETKTDYPSKWTQG